MLHNNFFPRITIAAIILALSACASSPTHWSQNISKEIDLAFSTHDANNTVPEDISAALLPSIDIFDSLTESAPPEPRFDISARRTPARAIFMSLVEGSPYSMIIHPDVKGRITLNLKNVTIEEAMHVIRKTYGYEYQREGTRYMVLGQGIQTRIFPVNYLNFIREGVSDTHVSSGELSQSGTGVAQKRGINVITTSKSDFWSELSRSLEALIGTEDGRRVIVNPQASLVVVKALPAEIDMVRSLLKLTQDTVNRQVMLEAKIIEVELNDGFQAGINWAGLKNIDGYNVLASQIGGGSLVNGSTISNLSGASGNLEPGINFNPIKSAATSAFGGIFSVAIQGSGFSAFVELLKTQGKVQVLSSPRVSTLNNQKAVIKVGGDEFFVTGISSAPVVSGATTVALPEIELTPFFSGIALDVTPHIDADHNIIMHIHPTVSTVFQRDKNFIVSGKSFTLPLAFSNIQESDNVVRAKSGQIIIIGGLMKEAITEENASIPILGDIPLIGALFRHKKIVRIKKELVILLKPTVIDNDTDWDQALSTTRARTHELMYNSFPQESISITKPSNNAAP